MTKPELTKLIGHDMCRLIAPTIGQTVPLKKDTILHTFSARDGKSTGSTRLEEDIQYTNVGTQDAYIKDQILTDEWLENNDERRDWNGLSLRPAKPGEIGHVISGIDFKAPNYDPQGRGYDRVQPGQCLWYVMGGATGASAAVEPDPDEEAIVSEVAAIILPTSPDWAIHEVARDVIETRNRVRRIVRQELAK